ncbi:MAG TPA: amino acid permease [Terriglobales bacterium]
MATTSVPTVSNAELPRRLGLTDSTAIVVGMMIGAGIFLVPNLIAQSLPSPVWIMAAWIVAGGVSLLGALGCAELSAALPATGGQYVFIREAYGPAAAFVCGWSLFTVGRSGQVAWLAVVFSLYVGYFTPLGNWESRALSLAVLALFTWINIRGVRLGALVQNSLTLAKVAGIVIIVAGAIFFAHRLTAAATVPVPATAISFSSFGVALIACLLAYDGWVQLSFVAGEIRNPQRTIARALILGTLTVGALYLLANFAYLHVLSIGEIAGSSHVGADAAARVFGASGGAVVALLILLSVLGSINGCFLTTPRVYFAQARDGLFFRRFGRVHPRYNTPTFAIVAQGVWSALLILSGSYETLLDYAIFGLWLFYALMIAAVIVLRRRRPDLPRPCRMWGYPVTPILFLAIAAWFLVNMLLTRPGAALAGCALVLSGLPAYWAWRRWGNPELA